MPGEKRPRNDYELGKKREMVEFILIKSKSYDNNYFNFLNGQNYYN
jgi:hypothetical protein